MASSICGRPSSTLLIFCAATPFSARKRCGAAGGEHLEAELGETLHRRQDAWLVLVAHRDEHACPSAAGRRRRRAGSWRRPARSRGRGPSPRRSSASPGRAAMSTPGKRAKGNTASLTAMWPSALRLPRREGASRLSPAMMRAAILAIGLPIGLGDEGHGARGARVDFEHEDVAVLDGVLHVHQAADLERQGERRRLALQLGDDRRRQRVHRQRAGASRPNGCRPPRYAP